MPVGYAGSVRATLPIPAASLPGKPTRPSISRSAPRNARWRPFSVASSKPSKSPKRSQTILQILPVHSTKPSTPVMIPSGTPSDGGIAPAFPPRPSPSRDIRKIPVQHRIPAVGGRHVLKAPPHNSERVFPRAAAATPRWRPGSLPGTCLQRIASWSCILPMTTFCGDRFTGAAL
jgi:hypothetical protein